jgi:uncharacterized protein
MQLLFLSDVHGAVEFLPHVVAQARRADLVLVGGDLTNFGGAREAEAVLTPLVQVYGEVRAVPGNTDGPEVLAYLEAHGQSLDGRGESFDEVEVYGCGGSGPTPLRGLIERPESDLHARLEAGARTVPGRAPRVVLTHAPPHGTALDRMFAGLHVGSTALRNHLLTHRPTLSLAGHVHEAIGREIVGTTLSVNAGAFAAGHFAEISLTDGTPAVTLRRLDLPRGLRTRIQARLVAQKIIGYLRHWAE